MSMPLMESIEEMLELLEELFEPNWALHEGSRKETHFHRRIARILVDNGRIGAPWDDWLKARGS